MEHKLSSRTDQIVQPDELLNNPAPHRLFIEARLGAVPEDELRSYREGHIHGAVYAQIREVFASPPTLQTGNLPLPDISVLQARLRQWHVTQDTEIIVYGPSMALAARAWWVLRWAGLSRVRVLDGGMKAWVACGGGLAQGDYLPAMHDAASDVVLRSDSLPSISVQEVDALDDSVLLIDARDEPSYLAGCIPGAVNLPASELWTPASNLRTSQEIQELFRQAGALSGKDVVVYCGGGVLSALEVLVLGALGKRTRLFVGSWSEWSRCPSRMAKSYSDKVSV
ncbi:MAG: sulfurtransferase [Burkholderiaceae bacterium]